MTIQEMHYAFKIAFNKVNNAQRASFNEAEIDWLLNEAQLTFVKQRIDGNNIKKTSAEETQKRIDDLQSIHIKYPSQGYINLSNPITQNVCGRVIKVYTILLSSLNFPYLYLTRLQAIRNNQLLSTHIVQTDDLQEALKSPFHLNKQQVIANIGDGKVFLYSIVDLNTALMEYFKIPLKVSTGTYTYLDGLTKPLQQCELPNSVHPEIVDLAVQLGLIYIGDPNVQLQEIKIQKQE